MTCISVYPWLYAYFFILCRLTKRDYYLESFKSKIKYFKYYHTGVSSFVFINSSADGRQVYGHDACKPLNWIIQTQPVILNWSRLRLVTQVSFRHCGWYTTYLNVFLLFLRQKLIYSTVVGLDPFPANCRSTTSDFFYVTLSCLLVH